MESSSSLSALPDCSTDALFARLAEPVDARPVVVCASHRQAQALQAAFAGTQIARGAEVWETPRIVAFPTRSEEHTSELPSLMRISYAVFCLKKKNKVYTT